MAASDPANEPPTTESRIVQAFNRFDEQLPAGEASAALRERLLGELLCDPDRVAATLHTDFELVMHSGAGVTEIGAAAIVSSVERQAGAGVLMWSEFDDLLTDGNVISGNGALYSLQVAERAITTFPVAVFLRFRGDRMISEVVFMGNPVTSTLPTSEAVPSVDRLRHMVGGRHLD